MPDSFSHHCMCIILQYTSYCLTHGCSSRCLTVLSIFLLKKHEEAPNSWRIFPLNVSSSPLSRFALGLLYSTPAPLAPVCLITKRQKMVMVHSMCLENRGDDEINTEKQCNQEFYRFRLAKKDLRRIKESNREESVSAQPYFDHRLTERQTHSYIALCGC